MTRLLLSLLALSCLSACASTGQEQTMTFAEYAPPAQEHVASFAMCGRFADSISRAEQKNAAALESGSAAHQLQ